jgi:hypothetical protein
VKERIKEFYKKHEDVIVLGSIMVVTSSAAFAASYYSVKSGLKAYEVDTVHLSTSDDNIYITYKNGDVDYYTSPVII